MCEAGPLGGSSAPRYSGSSYLIFFFFLHRYERKIKSYYAR